MSGGGKPPGPAARPGAPVAAAPAAAAPVRERPVLWHIEAPPKPAFGAPCNGCGLCCLAEPCPLGMLVSRRRHGPCRALRWHAAQQHYRCGLVAPAAGTEGVSGAEGAEAVAHAKAVAPPFWQRLLRALARRWIAAGSGCDAQVWAQPLATESAPSPSPSPQRVAAPPRERV